MKVKLREGGGRLIAKEGREEKQRQHAPEDAPERGKLSEDANGARDRLREEDRPFLILRPGAADSREQGKERDEIERDLKDEKGGGVWRFAEYDRSDSA